MRLTKAKTSSISIRLTEYERKQLENIAISYNLTLSQFIRKTISRIIIDYYANIKAN